MKTYINILILFFTTTISFSQTTDLPQNPKAGMCYTNEFDYSKKYKGWVEVDCNTIKRKPEDFNSSENVRKRCYELESYKEKLLNLGYKFDKSGLYSKSFIKAHNTYISDKIKSARILKRENRRKRKQTKRLLK